METKNLTIKGACENNLKNINVSIPRNAITCLIGVSGSGKSTLAYNIIYSEGQRQFLESVSTFAARLLKRTQRPDMDEILNLSPTVSIDQKRLKGSPRSTVGTTTEIYTYFRLLFSRFGSVKNLSAGHFSFNNPKGACTKCKGLGREYDVVIDKIADFSKSLAEGAINHHNYKPGTRNYNILASSKRLDLNKKLSEYTEDEKYFLLYTPRIEMSNKDSGFIQRFSHEGIISRLIKRAGDPRGQSNRKDKTDRPYLTEKSCISCNGARLSTKALESKINGKNIGYYSTLEIGNLLAEMESIDIIGATDIIKRIKESLQNLIDVKLDYLSLNRSLDTLSGGEAQRLKLARELGNNLIEMIYVMDEPTAGLHPRDRENIINLITKIRNSGNTVIAIEHNKDLMQVSDRIIEIGPKAGKSGGEISFTGSYKELLNSKTAVTTEFLKKDYLLKDSVREPKEFISLTDVTLHNLRNINIDIPLGVLCTFTGVSGSGKSTLLIDYFAKQYQDKVIVVDQSPLQGTARGNCATYTGIFDTIRALIASSNKTSKELFTFNGKGACPDCKGLGYKNIDMHFMGDVRVLCETCRGKRYKDEILEYKYHSKNISEILGMTVEEALSFFDENASIKNALETIKSVGLDYIELGQSHDTFSGGEAQRLKLAKQLQKKGNIFILDEPTAGLHFSDVNKLLKLLNLIVDNGNSVLVVEHNIQLIANADWIIDIGPEGGDKGGEIVATGTPKQVAMVEKSYTGNFLNKSLGI